MAVTYFKRYRMEIDLTRRLFTPPLLPTGYRLRVWDEGLLEAHAEAKFRSFRLELDANLFPCFCDREGCLRLMSEIANRAGFMAESTWLLQFQRPGRVAPEPCGTVQGLEDDDGCGSIQNIGITPAHRGHGLGSSLLLQSLVGFRRAGLQRASLEVTAQNLGAIRLYQRLGFRKVKTVYKAAEVAYA